MLQIDFLNMDLEAMITSASASGFPQFMAEVCKNLEYEELLKTRLVSLTFHNFLMDKNQRSIWIQASNKVFSTFLKDAFIEEKFPVVNYSYDMNMNIFLRTNVYIHNQDLIIAKLFVLSTIISGHELFFLQQNIITLKISSLVINL